MKISIPCRFCIRTKNTFQTVERPKKRPESLGEGGGAQDDVSIVMLSTQLTVGL